MTTYELPTGSHRIENDPRDGDGILGVFGREILSSSLRQQARWIESALKYWRARGFPYPRLEHHEAEWEFRCLERLKVSEVIRECEIQPSTLGLRLANSFHPQIWSVPARRHLRAPLDYFADDETLRKLLARAAQFWPDRRCWNAQCVRSALRIYAGGRVSNFRPAAARAIISRYSRAGQTVLDFSAGFGGRLLGCLTLDRTYVGIDPAGAQVAGLLQMISALDRYTSTAATVINGCAEAVMLRLDAESVDLVFSSPPYFNVEHYSPDETQSYKRYRTYQAWKEEFLRPILVSSYRALRRGGHLVINAANTGRHAIASDLETMAGTLFRRRPSLKLLMHSRPVQRSTGMAPYRWEPVFVFRKIS